MIAAVSDKHRMTQCDIQWVQIQSATTLQLWKCALQKKSLCLSVSVCGFVPGFVRYILSFMSTKCNRPPIPLLLPPIPSSVSPCQDIKNADLALYELNRVITLEPNWPEVYEQRAEVRLDPVQRRGERRQRLSAKTHPVLPILSKVFLMLQ